MIVETIKLYPEREDVTLTTYVLQDSPELLDGATRPAVLICPGGAYLSCSDREAEPVAMRFAAMGYHAFVLRYSVYLDKHEPYESIFEGVERREHTVFPAAIRDIGKAMLTIHKNSEAWLVDMDRIALCGFSAGAHNAAMYSVYWDKPILTDHYQVSEEKLRPAATILGYTLSDYLFMKATEKDEMGTLLFDASVTSLLGEATPSDKTLKEVSPALLVTEKTPPMFLWATASDALVPVGHTLRIGMALSERDIPFEMHVFEEGPHGLSLATQATANAKTLVDQNAAKWIDLADAWLLKRFSLDLQDKTKWD